jgi:small-conductance mechanosensitive channel
VAPAAEVPVGTVELQRRLVAAETAAAENLARAERAELREQAHQDKWAMEIDRLRQEVLARKSNAAEVRVLSDRVLQLSRELMAARSGIAE